MDKFVDKFVELLAATTARNQSVVSNEIKQSKISSHPKSNVLEARRILGQDSTAYLQSAVMLLWCGDQRDCDNVAMYPSSLPPRVEDYIVWDTILKDELARTTKEYDLLTGQIKTLLPLLAYFLNCEKLYELQGEDDVALRFNNNADDTVSDLNRLIDDNRSEAVANYASFLIQTLIERGEVQQCVKSMVALIATQRSAVVSQTSAAVGDTQSPGLLSTGFDTERIQEIAKGSSLSMLASDCVDVALFAPVFFLSENPVGNPAKLAVSRQPPSQFMQYTTPIPDTSGLQASWASGELIRTLMSDKANTSGQTTNEEYDDHTIKVTKFIASVFTNDASSEKPIQWMPIQDGQTQGSFRRSEHDASQVACYTAVLRHLVEAVQVAEVKMERVIAAFKMEYVLASILLLKNASRTVKMDKVSSPPPPCCTGKCKRIDVLCRSAQTVLQAFTRVTATHELQVETDTSRRLTQFYHIKENGAFDLSDDVQKSIVCIPRLAEGFDIDCIGRMQTNLILAMRHLVAFVRKRNECKDAVDYYTRSIQHSNRKASEELKAIDKKRFSETCAIDQKRLAETCASEGYEVWSDPEKESTSFSAHCSDLRLNENLSRRSAVWSDVLRELAISGDRLYSFLQTLAGIVHEDVQAIIKLEDPIVEGNQKALQAQRMDMQKQALAFQRSVLDALLNSVFRSSKIRIDVDRDPQSAANDLAGQIVVVSEESLERVKDLASGSSGVSFFEAQTQLHSYLSKQQGQPMQLKDLVSQVRQIIDDVMGKNSDQSFMIDITTQRAAMQYLAEPKNSMVVRLRPETYAAIRRAYDMLVTEFKSLQRNYRIHRYKSPPRAWECIEGPNRELTDQFAELSGHVLAHSRLFSGSASVYVGIVPAQINMAALKLSLRKTINRALECA